MSLSLSSSFISQSSSNSCHWTVCGVWLSNNPVSCVRQVGLFHHQKPTRCSGKAESCTLHHHSNSLAHFTLIHALYSLSLLSHESKFYRKSISSSKRPIRHDRLKTFCTSTGASRCTVRSTRTIVFAALPSTDIQLIRPDMSQILFLPFPLAVPDTHVQYSIVMAAS